MRTATDFDRFYQRPDPWAISHARFRDKVLRRCISQYVSGKSVLELGCGEGHLTEAVFGAVRSVMGIDISEIAVDRAKARNIPNARFENGDFLRTSFEGYDLIAALECLYYLSPEEQESFFDKIAREHSRKILILSAPIIGENQYRRYFTHEQLTDTFRRHRMTPIAFHNLNINRHDLVTTAAAAAARIAPVILRWMPTQIVYQRLYKIRTM